MTPRHFKFMILLGLFAASCMNANEKSDCPAPESKTVYVPTHDTILVAVHDTIYMYRIDSAGPDTASDALPFSFKPGILQIDQHIAETNICFYGVCTKANFISATWSKVRGAIGYNLYYSRDKSAGYSIVKGGSLVGNSRVNFTLNALSDSSEGVWYLKVEAINNKGDIGPSSDPKAFYSAKP